MTSRRFVTILFTLILVIITVQASNLRHADSSYPIQSSASDSSDNVTQDSTTSVSSDAQSGASGSEYKNRNIVQQDTSAPVGGVKAWAQCGGLYYLGETRCQQHTFCKQLSEFISVCFPESRPTEKVCVQTFNRLMFKGPLPQAQGGIRHFPFCSKSDTVTTLDFDFTVPMHLISFYIMVLATLTAAVTENQHEDTRSLLDKSDNGFSSSNSDSAADALDVSTTRSVTDEITVPPDTLAPSSTTPSVAVAQPIFDGVKMFGQCGGIFYSGYDPDAYCKQLSIYSSICTPKPGS